MTYTDIRKGFEELLNRPISQMEVIDANILEALVALDRRITSLEEKVVYPNS